jgi:hypothetical protein
MLALQELQTPPRFNLYLVINKSTNFSRHYLRNRTTSYVSSFSYIDEISPKKCSSEVRQIPPKTLCI